MLISSFKLKHITFAFLGYLLLDYMFESILWTLIYYGSLIVPCIVRLTASLPKISINFASQVNSLWSYLTGLVYVGE